ncbi:hypothetical protein CDAR_605051 [Caerostris darwini]|uniref:Uncharacterized protein n=1 Tax=Caerostris darwini TaxID=1538125 RepID=A0AAV4X615_9ARAC|nr:hypothetical protein CDAR_605051 [Caerostris darwini]
MFDPRVVPRIFCFVGLLISEMSLEAQNANHQANPDLVHIVFIKNFDNVKICEAAVIAFIRNRNQRLSGISLAVQNVIFLNNCSPQKTESDIWWGWFRCEDLGENIAHKGISELLHFLFTVKTFRELLLRIVL